MNLFKKQTDSQTENKCVVTRGIWDGGEACGINRYTLLPWWSYSKESACNAVDPGSVPGTGRFPGEGNSYPG